MANRQARIKPAANSHAQPQPHEDIEIPATVIDEPGNAAEETYAAFRSGFSDSKGCKVKVYRHTSRGRQYCFSDTPEAIESEETIRLFHARQPYRSEEGLYYLCVDVDGETRVFPVRIAPQVGSPETEPQQLNRSGGMADDRLIHMLDRMEQRLAQAERPPMLEMVEGLARLDALRGGTQQPQLPMDTLIKAIEIGSKLNNAGVPEDDWSSLLRSVIKDNAPAIGMLITSMVRKQQETPASRVGVTEGKDAATMTPEQQQEAQLQQALRGAIEFLKKKAARNSDPGLYVDMIVDNRDDPLYARLISDILANDFSAFAAIDPDIQKPEYFGFFRFIYDGIRSVFDEANKVASTPGGKTGNAGNASANGATGNKGSK